MNDFKKNITYQTTKLQKKTKTGSENENEMRRHVPLPVGVPVGGIVREGDGVI